MNEIKFPLELVNEDGTSLNNLPENPLKEKWAKLYPPTQKYESGEYCLGYSCISCDKCPYGTDWKVPEEDKDVWEEYQKRFREYIQIHNPNLYRTLYEPDPITIFAYARRERGDLNDKRSYIR